MNARKLVVIAASALIAVGLGLMVNTRLADLAPVAGLDLSQAPALGSPEAPNRIVLIESFSCPACRVFAEHDLPRLRKVVESGQARLYFVHLQLNEAAALAGIAAECVRTQSETGFWRYKRLLYRTQQQGFAQGRLLNLARDYLPGLELSAFESCLSERRTEERVRRDFAMVRRAGVDAVPTVLVNGRRVAANYYAVRAALDERR